jgi:YHS domain-containing protein
MIRTLFVEFLFPVLLFLILRSFLRGILTGPASTRPQRREPSRPTTQPGGELKKDPMCGTYVSTSASVTRTINGQVVHFCSKECSERYRIA